MIKYKLLKKNQNFGKLVVATTSQYLTLENLYLPIDSQYFERYVYNSDVILTNVVFKIIVY